ncbi:hypothetical protein EVY00_22315 [Citrobacter werkmanii]|nr:hypothetical protein F0329_19080 [Citrobacter werkmanii]RYH94025.1 hypothetical protein EVY00_22315 [Citrobacter werkmanii]
MRSKQAKTGAECFNASQLASQYQKASTSISGSNEHAISEKGFRSPHVHRFSETLIPVSV